MNQKITTPPPTATPERSALFNLAADLSRADAYRAAARREFRGRRMSQSDIDMVHDFELDQERGK